MNKKSIIAVFSVSALILGYLIGVFVGFPNVNSTLLSGDVGKANKHNQKTVNEEIRAVEEKLQNDSTYLQGTIVALLFSSERILEFEELVELTASVGGNQADLQPLMEPLNEMKKLAANAQKSYAESLDAINKIVAGEDADYENAMNHAALAYQLVAQEIKNGKIIVEQLDKILADKKKMNDELAYVRDAWSAFCSKEAVLNDDKMELAYWQDKNPLLDAEKTAAMANQFDQNLGLLELEPSGCYSAFFFIIFDKLQNNQNYISPVIQNNLEAAYRQMLVMDKKMLVQQNWGTVRLKLKKENVSGEETAQPSTFNDDLDGKGMKNTSTTVMQNINGEVLSWWSALQQLEINSVKFALRHGIESEDVLHNVMFANCKEIRMTDRDNVIGLSPVVIRMMQENVAIINLLRDFRGYRWIGYWG